MPRLRTIQPGEHLPRWRDLQPLLIRSAGVVGIAATIMAVVSSDALRSVPEAVPAGRNSAPADQADAVAPVIITGSQTDGAVAPAPIVAAPAAAPITVASVAKAPMPDEPAVTSAPPAEPTIADLRRSDAPASVIPDAPPVTTASVPQAATAGAVAPPAAAPTAAAGTDGTASTSLRSTAAAAPTEQDSAWADGAGTCPRDWVAGNAPGSAGHDRAGCTATDEIIATMEEGEQPALQAAANEHAESLAMAVPRIPSPRPDEVPVRKPIRVRAASGAGLGPPPNCAAGQRAKWHYVDRKAGTKEWYCR